MWEALVAALTSFDPMEWLTIGLVLFAGAQIFVQVRTEQQRLNEREADDARALDVAWQIAWAEHFRIDQLSDEWQQLDLVQLSALGVLNPSDVLPRDWSVLMSSLARLSLESGYLGGLALTLGHDLARSVATLNAIVKSVQHDYPIEGPERIVHLAREQRKKELQELETKIPNMTRDLSLLLFDAVRQSPRADITRDMNLNDDMRSIFGKYTSEALLERQRKALALAETSRGQTSKLLTRVSALFRRQ